jgi:hypothetical protein
MKLIPISLFLWTLAASALGQSTRDINAVARDLEIPPLSLEQPGPGKRVKQTLPDWNTESVYHILYLPTDWKPEKTYPVIIEYAGNGNYKNRFGDISTGRPEGSKMGFGLSAGKEFIWVCLPYLNNQGTKNVMTWWGDKPQYDPAKTVAYCKAAVPWICNTYSGNSERVILCGFSRGAIACNFIGLHDDEIAELWRAFIPYSHYDGGIERWPYPKSDRASARSRLIRLAGRPQFISDESEANLGTTRTFLESTGIEGNVTFFLTGFRNHNDAWLLRKTPIRSKLRQWLVDITKTSNQ